MAGNLQCIGFSATTDKELADTLMKVAKLAKVIHKGRGGRSDLWWQDSSGAAIALHDQSGRIECMTPYFSSPDGSTRWLAESTEPVLDPDCLECSGADCDLLNENGDLETRAAVQWVLFRPYQDWLKKKRRYRLEVAAFAERCECFSAVDDFYKGQKSPGWFGPSDTKCNFAENCFLPSGMFGDLSEGGLRTRARATFAGTVKSVIMRTNSLSRSSFYQLRVDTLPGLVDIVHPAQVGFDPTPGMIALVSA